MFIVSLYVFMTLVFIASLYDSGVYQVCSLIEHVVMQLLPPPQRVPLVIVPHNLPLVTPCIVALEKISCHYVAALLSVGSTRELDAVHTWVNNYSSWRAPYTSNRYVTALLFISIDKLARVPIQTSPLSRVLRRYKVSRIIFLLLQCAAIPNIT